MKKLFFLAILVYFSPALFSQPSDAAIKKDLTNETTIDIKFTKSTGTRQWNASLGNWEYVRGVHIRRRTAEYPGLVVKVVGDAVYQSMGGSTYSYKKFRIISNDWEGVPRPTEAEIKKFIATDWKKFYGFSYNKIINIISGPSLNKEKEFTWSKPTNALFYMTIQADILGDNLAVETIEQDYEIRFFRDDIKGPWTSFLGGSVKDKKVLSTRTATAQEYKKLEKQTLVFTVAEEAGRKELESVPNITIPDFASAKEMADFFHEILLNGDPGLLKLAMLKTSSRFLLAEGVKHS
ncbi:MAG: hypothetical protein IPL84_08855 [Chitinophagaceae bacterium]|nr:hypothetical protein [Chitinophagaceae bacterium]